MVILQSGNQLRLMRLALLEAEVDVVQLKVAEDIAVKESDLDEILRLWSKL